MKLTLLFLSRISILALSYLFAVVTFAQAQITPDNTVGTTVEQSGNVSKINNGTVRGGNLFHSFQDFSVPTGNEAHFNNADSVDRIFSRVTGGNISDIDGTIRANGSADLYLINPAGIVFGENARLDVGGSFLGSTADRLLFPDDVAFSASDTQTQPVLTINAPIGLGFRDNPGDITVRAGDSSIVDNFTGLTVPAGNDITLVGGDLSFNDGNILAIDSSVRLGSLDAAAVVILNEDGSLTFPNNTVRGNIAMTNSSSVAMFSNDISGGVYIDAKNLEISSKSNIFAGNNPDTTLDEQFVSANVVIDATESISIDGTQSTLAVSSPQNESTNSGKIDLATTNFSLNNGGAIFARGGADIIINAIDSVAIDSNNAEFTSAIVNSFITGSTSNSGNIDINTTNLSITNSFVDSSNGGQGNAGAININVTESASIEQSFILNNVESGAIGNTEGINIQAANLALKDSGISSSTLGEGDAGAVVLNVANSISLNGSSISNAVGTQAVGNTGGIEITTSSLSFNDYSGLFANVQGIGVGGDININATELISFNQSSIYNQSPIPEAVGEVGDVSMVTKNFISNESLFNTNTAGQGDSGNISISADSISFTNGSQLITSTSFITEGNAGNISFLATNTITVDRSYILSQVAPNIDENNYVSSGEGNAGDITIQTKNLLLTDGGVISTSTFGNGDAGNVLIEATGEILTEGTTNRTEALSVFPSNLGVNDTVFSTSIYDLFTPELYGRTIDEIPSGVNSQAGIVEGFAAEGKAGNIEIVANDMTISNGGLMSVSSFGNTNGGDIKIKANNITLDRGIIDAAYQPADFASTDSTSRFGGNVNLTIAENLVLRDRSVITANAANDAQGGNVNIDAGAIIAYPDRNNDIIANAAEGQGGNINIDAKTVIGIEEGPRNSLTNEINASSEVEGLEGNIFVNTLNSQPAQRTTELPNKVVIPQKTAEQACNSNRESAAKNGLAILGKGGVPPTPDLPLDSRVIYVEGNSDITPITQAENTIKTSKGNITPARGAEVRNGEIILTSYATGQDISGVGADLVNCGV